MGFALFTLASLSHPLRRITAWAHSHAPGHSARAKAHSGAMPLTLRNGSSARPPHQPMGTLRRSSHPDTRVDNGNPAAPARPLRVIHNSHADGACRLVISGRMADVCAELDRLALN